MKRLFILRSVAMIALGFSMVWVHCDAADFSLALKGGNVSLFEDQQTLEGRQYSFDSGSSQTFALAWDIRQPHQGFGFGMEYLHYANPYQTPVFAGTASTRALFFTAKYYLPFANDKLRAFAGLGIGTAYLSHYSEDADKIDNCTNCILLLPLQASVGVEWGAGAFGVLAEVKALGGLDGINYENSGHFDSGYNASGLGMFLGARLLF